MILSFPDCGYVCSTMRLISLSHKKYVEKGVDNPQDLWDIMQAPETRVHKEKSTFTTEHNSFNFAEDFSKRRNREPFHQQRNRQEERTSYTEDRVDALAL